MRDPGILDPRHFFSPGTFTRFARFLHNFTQFLRNFTRFLRFLRDFNAIFAIFTLFFARHKMSDPRHQKLFSRSVITLTRFSPRSGQAWIIVLGAWDQTFCAWQKIA